MCRDTRQLRGDDLAYATLSHIRAHPEAWDQRFIGSGYRACFIAWAIMLSHDNEQDAWRARYRSADDIVGYAARLLGWSRADASAVFGLSTRNYAVLQRKVRAIMGKNAVLRSQGRAPWWRRALRAGNIGKKVKEVELDPGILEPAPQPLTVPVAEPEREPEREPAPA